jgi:multidrug resistance efflux pump
MTLILVGIWLGFLWLLVKFGILKGWALWMKLSPVAVWLAVQVVLFLPMTWSALSGPVTVVAESVGITPNVSGVVIKIQAKSWVPIKKGDILFQLDPEIYKAAVERIEAQLKLAQLRVQQKSTLLAKGVGRGVEVESTEAQVKQLAAQLRAARWDLDQTTVRAPIDGVVPGVILQPGSRVSTSTAVMALIDTTNPIVDVQIAQNHLRHIKVGQAAEVIFPLYPGKTFPAKVAKIYRANPVGQLQPSGLAPSIKEAHGERFVIALVLDDPTLELPVGAAGTAAIYTAEFPISHVFRQITLRMTTWLNFITGG